MLGGAGDGCAGAARKVGDAGDGCSSGADAARCVDFGDAGDFGRSGADAARCVNFGDGATTGGHTDTSAVVLVDLWRKNAKLLLTSPPGLTIITLSGVCPNLNLVF